MMPKMMVTIPTTSGGIVKPNIIHYLLFKITNALSPRQTSLNQTEILLLIYKGQHTPNNKKDTNNYVKR